MKPTSIILLLLIAGWHHVTVPLFAQSDQAASAKAEVGRDFGFKVHRINAESEFSAAGLIDVNQDGKKDIVCGAWWYEAPIWTKHLFREVEKIRGRFDDYSNLVLDVNGDGLEDIVSVNYRSQSLYWCQNPGWDKPAGQQADGNSNSLWPTIVIDRPGTSETGRLADINGDGQLDVLPSGTNFAAWYEIQRLDAKVDWKKHELPHELIGHGIGVGDLNGDGRNDLVSPRGWAEAPADPDSDRWIWHPEFTLARDCGLPILCWDVDGDGDLDLVWGRGHNIGLYWTEQVGEDQWSIAVNDDLAKKHANLLEQIRTRKWIHHAIDTSWASLHTLLTADIDGDGVQDLIVGKRFQGHDGKDPGENDPLSIYWYRFDSTRKIWQRHLISDDDRCAIDLDSVCADLDGDGDFDIVAPSRIGLCWIENLQINSSNASNLAIESDSSPAISGVRLTPSYDQHQDLSYLIDTDGQRREILTKLDHGVRRHHILEQMQQVMGSLPLPDQRVALDVQIQSIVQADGYSRIHLTYAADIHREQIDRVPAFLLVPDQLAAPTAAMLCLHQTHFELGKGEPCGLGGSPNLHLAHELAQRGFVCLAPDYPGFSEYAYDFSDHSDQYLSGTMKGIWNHIRAVDLLEALPCVRRDAIGVIGHSLGGHNALFVSAMDQRLRCAVTSCGFNAFEDYYQGNLAGWSSDRYMPRIASVYGNSPQRVPFDFPEVLAAIAPRPIFVNAPVDDDNFAIQGVRRCEQAVRPLYAKLFDKDDLVFIYPYAQHDFPTDVRHQTYQWLARTLKKP